MTVQRADFTVTLGNDHNTVDDLRRRHRRKTVVGLGFVVVGGGLLLYGAIAYVLNLSRPVA